MGCVIITGRGRAFAAGADIKEILPLGYADQDRKIKYYKNIKNHHTARKKNKKSAVKSHITEASELYLYF